MRLSKFTVFFGAYIIVSAAFIQQVWGTWRAVFGYKALGLSLILLSVWILLAILYKRIKSGFNLKRVILICLIYALGFIFAWRQPYMVEKAHVLEYGILAWLAMRDLCRNQNRTIKPLFSALIFILAVASLDEGFQKLLPWRVCDPRDILTNALSGVLGVALFILR